MYSLNGFGADDYVVYTVASGDTLDKIAKKHGTTYQEIAKTNQIDDPNKIEVGQQLMIYTKPVAKAVAKSISQPVSSFSFPKMSNSTINYALIGGIVALGIPLAIKLIRQARP